MTLLTPVHSGNDSRVYFLTMFTSDYCWHSWTCCIAAPYKFRIDWLIDWLAVDDTAYSTSSSSVYIVHIFTAGMSTTPSGTVPLPAYHLLTVEMAANDMTLLLSHFEVTLYLCHVHNRDHCENTWRHPQNRKYTMYCTTATAGPSRQHAQKIRWSSAVWFSGYARGQTNGHWTDKT